MNNQFSPFYLIKCASFLWKLKRVLTLMIKREKGIRIGGICFYNTFDLCLALKMMNFENVVIYFYVVKGMNA
jgi:hypothetical protein